MEGSIIQCQEKASRLKLVLSTVLALLPGFTGGASITYTAVAVPFYLDPDNKSGLVMTEEQASWFVSLNAPMQLVGNLLSGFLLNFFGRKRTIVGSSVVVIIASAILSLAPSYEFLLLGCFIKGAAVGVVRPAVGLYISEISIVRWRGSLGSCNALTPNAGYLYAIMVGTQFHLKYFPWIMVVPSIIFLLFSWVLVDTPLWYVKMGRKDEARKSMKWLRGPEYDIEPEIKELEDLLSNNDGGPNNVTSLYKRSFLLPTFILCGLFFIYASSGADTFSYYALTLFKYPGVSLSPSVIAVLFQMSYTLGMLTTAILPEMNRRPQFILGAVSLALHMFLLAADTHLGFSTSVPSLNYFPVILLVSYAFNFGIGIGTIPFTLTGEVFPQHLRTYGCAITTASRYVMQFIQLKFFFLSVSHLGLGGTYCIQASVALCGSVFAFCLLPETRHKTFTELEHIFQRRNNRDDLE